MTLQNKIIQEFGSAATQESYLKKADNGLWASEKILIDKYFKPKSTILDIGCGTGRTTISLHQLRYKVLGIDITPEMIQNAQKIKDRTLYAYNPHFWFYLAGAEIEKQYNRSMKELDIKTYIIIGSNSFLDQWNARFFDKAIIKHWLSPKPFYPDQKKYINYIGEYLIEVKLKKDIAQKIENLFEKITSLADIPQLELISVFQEKSLCTITISKNAQRGKTFKRKIKRHF